MSEIVEPHGSLRIEAERNGIPANVSLFFVFDGDWANMFDDVVDSEEEAYALFVDEVRRALEARREESRRDTPAVGQADTENRGASGSSGS